MDKRNSRFSTTASGSTRMQRLDATTAAGRGRQIEMRKLATGDKQLVLDYLNRHPLHNLTLIGFIRDNGVVSERNRGTFYGYFCDGLLAGVALIGHHTLLSGDSNAAHYFAEAACKYHLAEIRNVLGKEDLVEAFCHLINAKSPNLRILATEKQALCVATELNTDSGNVEGLRLVKADELDEVAALHARTYLEWNGVDPAAADPEGFRKRMLARIEKERMWVIGDEQGYAFKTDIVSESDAAVYLEGVLTRTDLREKGFGSAALKALCRRLLEQHPAVCLFADADDVRALSFYLKAGFTKLDTFSLVRYQPTGN